MGAPELRYFGLLLAATVVACVSSNSSFAADLIIDDQPYPEGYVSAPVGKWDGPFVGVFGGFTRGTVSQPINFDFTGMLLGVNAGANFSLENGIVLGVVGDVAWSNATDPELLLPPGAFDMNWFGSVRGRVGYDAGAFLPYLTAGLAAANGKLTASTGSVVASNVHLGWTVGAGVEVQATENLSIDLAYRYSDYGARSYGVLDWEFVNHQVTAGLNWRF